MPEPWDLVSGAYAEEVVPQFEEFAREALRVADVKKGARVLDVACGPGTLSVLAARAGAQVDALDFAPAMVAELRARVERERLAGVARIEVGDGQNLPFADASYDAAFSMFGLMFFPDRARGFAELHRCLKPGGVAVVSSWQPMEANVPFLAMIFSVLRKHVPNLPFGSQEAPLSNDATARAEMSAAGFGDVVVHGVQRTFHYASTADGWASMQRTMAPLAMLSRKMGPAWPKVAEGMLADFVTEVGAGPQAITMPAWLSVGRR